MGRIMVSVMLIFCSLALVNRNRGIIRDTTTGWGQCSYSFEHALDCKTAKDEQICWARGFKSISGPNMAFTTLDLDDKSTAIALSEINQTAGMGQCSDSFEQGLDCGFGSSLQQEHQPMTSSFMFVDFVGDLAIEAGQWVTKEGDRRRSISSPKSRIQLSSLPRRIAKLQRHGRRISIGVGVAVRSNISIAGKAVFKVGVAVNSNITRFSTDVFEATIKLLPYEITYKLIPFAGSSHKLINKVARETLDVAIGDMVTPRDYNQHVEFSLPYLEPGFMIVAKAKTRGLNEFWWFLSPFTRQMWLIIAALNVLIGMVIWVIESQYDDGPNFLEALFLLQGRPARNTSARIMVTVRVFLMLILTQVYTTMLANSLQEPSILDFNSLRQTNVVIGCDGQSQTIWHLVKVLGFNRRNVKIIASVNDYKEALYNGSIKAAFLLTPHAKVLLAKHCPNFIEINPSHGNNLGDFRFALPMHLRRSSICIEF